MKNWSNLSTEEKLEYYDLIDYLILHGCLIPLSRGEIERKVRRMHYCDISPKYKGPYDWENL